jgi:hypothetical protein
VRALEKMTALTSLAIDREPAPGAAATFLASAVPSRLQALTLTGHDAEPASIVTHASLDRLEELTLQGFRISVADAHAMPNVLAFHALGCEYEPGAQDVLRARWSFARTT